MRTKEQNDYLDAKVALDRVKGIVALEVQAIAQAHLAGQINVESYYKQFKAIQILYKYQEAAVRFNKAKEALCQWTLETLEKRSNIPTDTLHMMKLKYRESSSIQDTVLNFALNVL